MCLCDYVRVYLFVYLSACRSVLLLCFSCQLFFHICSPTPSHSHRHTHTHTLSHTLTHTLSHTYPSPSSSFLPLSLTHTHTRTDCASCVFNRAESNCKRHMKWTWRGEYSPATMGEVNDALNYMTNGLFYKINIYYDLCVCICTYACINTY